MYTFETTLGSRSFVVETGKMAKQANGAVLVRYGETVVLVTATASAEPREGVDFFPLTVDYEEKMYAVGKIPGGFIKREGRPAESAILNSRLIDRPIRPLFPEGYRNDVQIVATVLSVEQDNAPEIAGMIGASCALSISDIPFLGPIAGVRVGRIDGEFVINPTVEQREKSDLNLTVAGSYDAVMMVEAGANELSEEVVLDAILFGHEEIKRLVKFQQEMMEKCGKEKHQPKLFTVPEELVNAIHEYTYDKFDAAVRDADKIIGELNRADKENILLIVNRIRPDMVAKGEMLDLDDINDILAIKCIGQIPDDEMVVSSTNRGEPVIANTKSQAGIAYQNITRRLCGEDVPFMTFRTKESFFARLKKLF